MRTLILAFQSFGVVFGSISLAPLFVFKCSFSGRLRHYQDEDIIFGVLSLIFWTSVLIPLLKYVTIVLSADDNGEGGIFALYSLLCRYAKLSLLPNQQTADEELSSYYVNGLAAQNTSSSPLKRILEKHKRAKFVLLTIVLLGVSMVIGTGVLMPAISVLSSLSGLENSVIGFNHGEVVVLSCILLVGLFVLLHRGTQKAAVLFAPVVFIWVLGIGAIGLYNILHWNPNIYQALSPYYIVNFFQVTGTDGWISLGAILLSITGTEAMFTDLGHFGASSIRLAFVCFVFPCLTLQYMGQAAFLSQNLSYLNASFYSSIPEPVFWPVFVVAVLAAMVGSQSVISGIFSSIKRCNAFGCFPRVKLIHTSRWMDGRIYIPEVNWILMVLCLAVTIGFHEITLIGNAYSVTCITYMFVTTLLMSLAILFVWQGNLVISLMFFTFFGIVEAVYLSSSFAKFTQGGWLPVVLSVIFMIIMFVWHYGMRRKYLYDQQKRVQIKDIIEQGPSLGVVRVPGIGLIYTELVNGIPPIFTHFMTNLPAFYQVLVFMCVKTVPVPYVFPDERYLIGRIGPRSYRMYRVIARYGYEDVQQDNENFENDLIINISKFIQMEAEETFSSGSNDAVMEGRMAVIRTTETSGAGLVMSEDYDQIDPVPFKSSKSETLLKLQSVFDHESQTVARRRHVRFELSGAEQMDEKVKEEMRDLVHAKQAGVAYIIGHSYIKASKTSNILKKFIIDVAYAILRKNCRGPSVTLHIPHISLIEVGMIYTV